MSELLLEQEKDKVVKDFLQNLLVKLENKNLSTLANFGAVSIVIDQVNHGFLVGERIFYNGNMCSRQTIPKSLQQVVGIVIGVISPNRFTLNTLGGESFVDPIQSAIEDLKEFLENYE